MKNKTMITDTIEQFHFEDEHNTKLDLNITALVFGKSALLIDTGYRNHAEEVLMELGKRNIQVTDIVLSHYHPDHAAGASVFKGANCYCSEHYLENYRLCSEVWDADTPYVKATKLLKSGQTIEFGRHKLKFYDSKSHSADSLIIEIDDAFLMVGDLIMRDIEHKTTYPYICKDGDITGYLDSLKMIRELKNHKLLLAHGTPVTEAQEIETIVTEHENYLSKLKAYGEGSSNQAIMPHWSFFEWHQNNLKFIQT